MAVFLENVCKFDRCGKIFPTLPHLIIHIEDSHINYDALIPKTNGEASQRYLPLSYILKYQSTVSDYVINETKQDISVIKQKITTKQNAKKTKMLAQNQNSSDSFTVEETKPKNSIKRKSKDPKERPFACTIAGCHKRYKNVNGIKYHIKNGHKSLNMSIKQYCSMCGKSFKTIEKLNTHYVVCVNKYGLRDEMSYCADYYASNAHGANNVIVQSNGAHLYETPLFDGFDAMAYGSAFGTPRRPSLV